MIRRKPIDDDDENPERWLVSYADFITLLFAFFVVMYAISSVNQSKYDQLTSAMGSAFMGQANGGKIIPMSDMACRVIKEWTLRSGIRSGPLFLYRGSWPRYRPRHESTRNRTGKRSEFEGLEPCDVSTRELG